MIEFQSEDLLELSSIHDWNNSIFGKFLRIANVETFQILRRYWRLYSTTSRAHMEQFKAGVKKTYNRHYKNVQSTNTLMEVRKRFWEYGTITPGLATSNRSYCNPLFMYSAAGGSQFSVNKNTSPLAGFHGIPIISPTPESSSSQATQDRHAISDEQTGIAVIWGMKQWQSWCEAFHSRVVEETNSNKRSLQIRFYIGDAVHFA